MLLYVDARMTLMSLSIGCNRFHNVEKRLARWLLMMQDCARTDEFKFTQDIISRTIGTRRPHVSTAANSLHQRVACECYLYSKVNFEHLFSA